MSNAATQKSDSRPRRHFIPEWAAHRKMERRDIMDFTGADKGLVSRWYDGTLPSGKYINLLAQLFGVNAVDLFVDPAIKEAELGAEIPLEGLMPVDGFAAASTWQESDELAQEAKDWIPFVRDPGYPNRRQYAIEVRGNSMDKLVRSGEYVIVVEAFGQAARDGDVVVVRRKRGHLVERTIKRYRETVKGGILMPESTDAKYEPIPATGEGDTEIEIEAFVIGRYGRIGNR